MEFKGTKGFWKIGVLGSVQNERGEFICESERNNGSEEENKANNLLISCAPELLERLVELNAFCTMSKKDREENEALIMKATTI